MAERTVALLTANWCPQCPAAQDFWHRMAEQYDFRLFELDIDGEQGWELAARYDIQAVPVVIVDGQVWKNTLDEAEVVRFLASSEELVHQTL